MNRTLEAVTQEYSNVCAKLGNITYQVKTLSKEAELLHEQLTDLNLEAAALQAAAKESK